MAVVTICSDFGAPQNKSLSLFPLFPQLFAKIQEQNLGVLGSLRSSRKGETVGKHEAKTFETCINHR